MIEIWAPHPDDEIIGCFSVLEQHGPRIEVYFGEIEEGCARSAQYFGFQYHLHDTWTYPSDTVYAPDPFIDFHPRHQRFGHEAMSLFRRGRIKRLVYYATTMYAPYIWEVPNPSGKREALNRCYKDKEDLWRYEHKWFLFEGYWEMRRLEHEQ